MDALDYEKDMLLYFLRTEIKKFGITKFAKKVGIRDSNLSKALSEGQNPTLDTIVTVLRGLDLQIQLVKRNAHKNSNRNENADQDLAR